MPPFENPITHPSNRVRLVVASSVMLTFISYWRAAAIVLNDLGSSAFYAAGIAEEAVGKTAPWFILGVMLFSFAVRAVYVESCSMFTRGGVYRVVKEALGGTFAKISVSALMFDYVLTGPISGVSAGQYIVGLLNEFFTTADAHFWIPRAAHTLFHGTPQLPVDGTSALFAVLVTLYYWWENVKGIEESSDKALRVMQITTVMVILLLGWGIWTALVKGAHLPPFPRPGLLHFSDTAQGFLKGTGLAATGFGLFGILMAFGHSVLAMSGEESLAQVNREIESPKLKNLKRAAIVIAIYSFIFTGFGSLLASMLIPDAVRVSQYRDNLIAGMAMFLVGPLWIRLIFRTFVVIVGFLILSGAINTSIIGSTGVLNRVAEDGVLADWFRSPHPKFGTTTRIVNLVSILQLFIILVSRGNVIMLGEAYAFGVIWSFTFNSLAMLVLRYKYHGFRGWKVPPNIYIRGVEIPVGLASVFLVLLATALTNLFTKSVATISGIIFSIVFFAIFTVSEKINRRRALQAEHDMQEHFQLVNQDTVDRDSLEIAPGCVLVTVRDFNALHQLKWVLQRTNTNEQDVVVLAVRLANYGPAEYEVASEQVFSEHEQTLFTKAVSVAESFGKHVSLLVVPARDVFHAIVQTAVQLEASAVVSGLSTKLSAQEQSFRVGQAWEALPEPKRQFSFYVVQRDGMVHSFTIGPHDPTLQSDDVQLVHRLWLMLRKEPGMQDLHHSDIVTYALTRLARDYGREKDDVLRNLGQPHKSGSYQAPLPPRERFEGPKRSDRPPTEPR